MSAERANPAFTIRVLRKLVDEMRKHGVTVLHLDDLEQIIAHKEARRG